jgi:hypothetical protein
MRRWTSASAVRVARQVLLAELLRERLMPCLGRCEIAQQLAHTGIGRTLLRALVELPRLVFALLRLMAHGVEAERAHHPDRLVLDEAADVLAPDERYVLAEALAVDLDQPAAMLALLLRHLGEHLGRCGIVVGEPVRVLEVDALILLLERDGEREDLLFAQLGKVAHALPLSWSLIPSLE